MVYVFFRKVIVEAPGIVIDTVNEVHVEIVHAVVNGVVDLEVVTKNEKRIRKSHTKRIKMTVNEPATRRNIPSFDDFMNVIE